MDIASDDDVSNIVKGGILEEQQKIKKRKIVTAISEKPSNYKRSKGRVLKDTDDVVYFSSDINQATTASNSSDNGDCPKTCYIGSSFEAPAFMKRNWILKGYRIGFSLSDIPKTLFMVHNETTNIWSHLLGFLFFVFLMAYITFWTMPDASITDYDKVSAFYLIKY